MPRRNHFVVSSANQRSTMFIHELSVGVKCKVKRGTYQPAVDLWGLVGRDVVDDQVHIEVFGHAAVDEVQELLELDGSVALGHVHDDLPRSHVERGVEVGGAAADVVVRGPLGEPGTQRQDRGGAVEGLNLGLLVHAQHKGSLGRLT